MSKGSGILTYHPLCPCINTLSNINNHSCQKPGLHVSTGNPRKYLGEARDYDRASDIISQEAATVQGNHYQVLMKLGSMRRRPADGLRPSRTPVRAFSKLGVKINVRPLTPRLGQSSVGRNDCGVRGACVRAGLLAQSPPDRTVCWILGLRYQPSPASRSDARHTVRLHQGQTKAAPALVSEFRITMSYMYVHLVRYRPCKNPT